MMCCRWLLLLGLLALAAAADEYDEYEDAPAPAPVKPLRPSPLLRQARGPVIGRPAPKSAVCILYSLPPIIHFDCIDLKTITI